MNEVKAFVEFNDLHSAFHDHDNNPRRTVKRAAELLFTSRNALYDLMRSLGVDSTTIKSASSPYELVEESKNTLVARPIVERYLRDEGFRRIVWELSPSSCPPLLRLIGHLNEQYQSVIQILQNSLCHEVQYSPNSLNEWRESVASYREAFEQLAARLSCDDEHWFQVANSTLQRVIDILQREDDPGYSIFESSVLLSEAYIELVIAKKSIGYSRPLNSDVFDAIPADEVKTRIQNSVSAFRATVASGDSIVEDSYLCCIQSRRVFLEVVYLAIFCPSVWTERLFDITRECHRSAIAKMPTGQLRNSCEIRLKIIESHFHPRDGPLFSFESTRLVQRISMNDVAS